MANKRRMRHDILNEMMAAASDISTQDTSTDIAMKVINYMTKSCASSRTEPLAFWQQHSRCFPMLSKLVNLQNYTTPCLQHQYLSKQCSQQLVSFWMASDWCGHQTSSIEFHSLMTIMRTCLILNRKKNNNEREWLLIFSITLSLISSM